MIRAVVFDLMDTVLYDPYREAIEAATGKSVALLGASRDREAWPAFECAHITEAEFVRRFFSEGEKSLAFDSDAFHLARRAGYRFLPGMLELIGELDGRAKRFIASNYPVWVEE